MSISSLPYPQKLTQAELAARCKMGHIEQRNARATRAAVAQSTSTVSAHLTICWCQLTAVVLEAVWTKHCPVWAGSGVSLRRSRATRLHLQSLRQVIAFAHFQRAFSRGMQTGWTFSSLRLILARSRWVPIGMLGIRMTSGMSGYGNACWILG